jgi:3-oxoacyl-[acyl-carrier protein] reductase
MQLENKIAVITGSGRGIGRAIALQLATAGANSVVSDIDAETSAGVVAEIEAIGRDAISVTGDISRLSEAQLLINKAVEKFGQIDFLVNNAGITRDNLLMRMSEEEWDSVIAVNLKGTYNCMRAVTKTLMKQRSGRIINIASVVGQMGNPTQINYAASKAGVIGMTKSAAKELASRNILVNAVAPGFIETAMTAKLPEQAREKLTGLIPLNRLGEPEDVAKVVLFLCSESANYITGQVLNVDGGMVM